MPLLDDIDVEPPPKLKKLMAELSSEFRGQPILPELHQKRRKAHREIYCIDGWESEMDDYRTDY